MRAVSPKDPFCGGVALLESNGGGGEEDHKRHDPIGEP